MDEEQLKLSRKEVRALQVLRDLLPKIGKFNETDWPSVMHALRTRAGIEDEAEAERVMASLESHGLVTCNKYQSTPSYSAQTTPTKILFKGFVTSKGIQFLRKNSRSALIVILSVALYVSIGAILLVIFSLVTGFTDLVSAIWIGGLAGLGLKVYNIIETNVLSHLVED
ncbi:MAG: hypothetical protein QXU73_06915 [Thermoplasmata archaeon]